MSVLIDTPPTLHSILEAPEDGAFDAIARLAARLFGVPIAIVSVVDDDQIWFTSAHGVDAERIHLDGDPGKNFYAGCPLTADDGHNLGTLYIVDRQPRDLDAGEIAALHDLAGLVVRELELRLATRHAFARESQLRAEADAHRVHAEALTAALQASLLPLSLPSIRGIEIAARFEPADGALVGGDFYDVFALPQGAWGVVIADVCGKGPEAAAFSAAVRYALRSASVDHDSPSRVLEVVNETLLIDGRPTDEERFCTIAYARLEPVVGGFALTVACGGHPLPLVARQDGHVHQIGAYGSLVGVLPKPRFTDTTTHLAAGDALVLFTDGLSEARLELGDDMLGDGLIVRVAENAALSPTDLVNHLAKVAGAGQGSMRDDLAIIVLRVADTCL